jgi:hypothetical protein
MDKSQTQKKNPKYIFLIKPFIYLLKKNISQQYERFIKEIRKQSP